MSKDVLTEMEEIMNDSELTALDKERAKKIESLREWHTKANKEDSSSFAMVCAGNKDNTTFSLLGRNSDILRGLVISLLEYPEVEEILEGVLTVYKRMKVINTLKYMLKD